MTFAGSPDRVEAQLVPDAGYEFDTFRITGLPRRPSPALVHAALLRGRAPLACARILERRRPDVVFGAGGYVAGPMVYAAWRKRTPAALSESDARLGLANRLAARFARRIFLAYELPDRSGAKYRVVGRPIPEKARPMDRSVARAQLGLPAEGPVCWWPARGRCPGAERARDRGVRRGRAARAPRSGERDFEAMSRRVSRADYRLVPVLDGLGAAYGACDLAIMRAGSTVWELAAAGLPAILVPYPFATADHQTLNARYFARAGAAIAVPETELGVVPELARSLLDDPGRLALMAERMLRARPAGCRAGHRGGTDRRLPPLDGRRIWFVGIGGAGLSAYATIASAWGAEVGGWDRVETEYLAPLRRHELVIEPEPVVPDGWEVVVSSAYPDVSGKSRAEFLAELVSLRESIVVAGAHGKTTTTGMIAYVLAQLGRDPAYAIGGEVPQLGGNAAAGEGWFVVEGDESDRTIAALRPPSRSSSTSSSTTTPSTPRSPSSKRSSTNGSRTYRTSCAPRSSTPVDFELALPGEHNRLNAAAALAALELCGVDRDEAQPHIAHTAGGAALRVARGSRWSARLRRLRPSSDRGRGDARNSA